MGHVENVLLKERTALTCVRLVADEIIILGFTEHVIVDADGVRALEGGFLP